MLIYVEGGRLASALKRYRNSHSAFPQRYRNLDNVGLGRVGRYFLGGGGGENILEACSGNLDTNPTQPYMPMQCK